MKRAARKPHRGMSLLEITIASSMLAVLLAAVSLVMRTGRLAWDAHEADYTRLESAHATMRHIVREIRQARAVIQISDPLNANGTLTVQDPSGTNVVWAHDGASQSVNFGPGAANQLLAPTITSLRFEGYRADGVTPTTTPEDVQCIRIEVTVQLPRESGGNRSISSWAWLRSW